jgi:hypothetical protein
MTKLVLLSYKAKQEEKRDPTQQLF